MLVGEQHLDHGWAEAGHAMEIGRRQVRRQRGVTGGEYCGEDVMLERGSRPGQAVHTAVRCFPAVPASVVRNCAPWDTKREQLAACHEPVLFLSEFGDLSPRSHRPHTLVQRAGLRER